MREDFLEIEFQVAVMMAYYNLFKDFDELNIRMPSAKEEKDAYGSDWVFQHPKGVAWFLQFKRAKSPTKNQKVERSTLKIPRDSKPLYRFDLHKANKSSSFDQHNLLFDKSLQDFGFAFYVAPCFATRAQLNLFLKRVLNQPARSKRYFYKLYEGAAISKSRSLGDGKMDFLQDVIYIEPHRKVNPGPENHSYHF